MLLAASPPLYPPTPSATIILDNFGMEYPSLGRILISLPKEIDSEMLDIESDYTYFYLILASSAAFIEKIRNSVYRYSLSKSFIV